MAIPVVSWATGAARWLWNKIRGRPTVHADRGAVAAGRDQHIGGSVVTGPGAIVVDRGGAGLTIVAQSGATVNVYVDDLPKASPPVRDPFEEGRRLQNAEQHEAAIREFEKAFAAAQDDHQRCALHVLIGKSFLNLGRQPEARSHYRQALGAADLAGDEPGAAAALTGLGVVSVSAGEADGAEEYHQKAFAIYDRLGDRLGQADNLAALGTICALRGTLVDAEERFRSSLAIYEGMGSKVGQALTLTSLGLVYAARRQPDKAEDHLKRALAMAEEAGNRTAQAIALRALGMVSYDRSELSKAEERLRRALALHQDTGDKLGEANDLVCLALLSVRRKEPRKARELLNQAKALYEAIGAGGEGPEIVRRALEHLGAVAPRQPEAKPKRSRRPRKRP
jgi:tetratricopeptide (TPR) repeat protein